MKNYLTRTVEFIRSLFLNGLFILLPITLTFALFRFSFHLLKGWLVPIYSIEPTILKKIPHSEIIIVLLAILLMGFIAKFVVLTALLEIFEKGIQRVPLLRQVYFGIKQIVHAFTAQDKLSFQQVVLIEFPRQGMYSIGFITGQVSEVISPSTTEKYYNIFIPTTPNPTTGYFICTSEANFSIIDLTRQEAMALIISGGIIQPQRHIDRQNSK